MDFRKLLEANGATFASTMVANRGFHNPTAGSFSFFEMVELKSGPYLPYAVKKDEFFFGHFTTPTENNQLTLEQNPMNPSLMIELIVWDKANEVYNFYELIGSPQGSHWFYRGNSADIWADTENLHKERVSGVPIFGQRLRCSGCHISGGPIMKEITEPFDSWWRIERPLPLGGRSPDENVSQIMANLRPPQTLQEQTLSGLHKLLKGRAFKSKALQSPQVALRPLFCPEELNLAASPQLLLGNENDLMIPTSAFVDARLGGHHYLPISRKQYLFSLQKHNSHFPETNLPDSDHVWNSPTKAISDQLAIEELIALRFIDYEFAADVLAVDFTRPVFSQKRCNLLKLLPPVWSSNWPKQFQLNLLQNGTPEAEELLTNLTEASRTITAHQQRAGNFLHACAAKLQNQDGLDNLLTYLGQTRAEVSASEISQNPRGQILEPGFRVIFPTFSPSPEPWRYNLNESCDL